MKLSLTLFFIAGAVATENRSAGSLRALGKGGNPKVATTHTHRCKDRFDPNDWFTSCSGVDDAGKDGLDTCQPCCECDCNTSPDTSTPKETCEELEDYELADDGVTKVLQGEYTCAEHGHVDPENGSCDDAVVVAACDAICNA